MAITAGITKVHDSWKYLDYWIKKDNVLVATRRLELSEIKKFWRDNREMMVALAITEAVRGSSTIEEANSKIVIRRVS